MPVHCHTRQASSGKDSYLTAWEKTRLKCSSIGAHGSRTGAQGLLRRRVTAFLALWLADAARSVTGSYGLLTASEHGNATGTVKIFAIRTVKNMPDDVTMIDGDLDLAAFTEFPGGNRIGQGPQTESLSLGTIFEFLPGFAFRPGTGFVSNPGEACHNQFFIEAGAAFQIDQGHRLSELVFGAAFTVKWHGFHFYQFPVEQS